MLFSTIKNKKDHPDEIMEFVPVSQSFSFKALQPFLETSEYSFMRTLFSDKVYNQIESYYTQGLVPQPTSSGSASGSNEASGSGSASGSNGSSDETTELVMIKALRFFQTAEINYAFYKGLAKLSVYISGDGIHRISNTESGKQTSYQYQMHALETSFKEDAFTAIDLAFRVLESNQAIFPDFSKSSYYTIVDNCFVKNADEFSKEYSISNSRVVFLNLIPHMMKAQNIDLPHLMGHKFYSYIKSNVKSNDEKLTEIIKLTKSAIVQLTIARAVESFGVNFTDKGLFFEKLESGNSSNKTQILLSADEKHRISQTAKADAQSYIESLISEIQSVPDLEIEYSDNNKVQTVGGKAGTVWAL